MGPKVVITNGMVIPNYSRPQDYDKMFAMGVSMYGKILGVCRRELRTENKLIISGTIY
jgi:urocanate hydratase